uniref:Uncharacterized protein n=1 Tax=Lepeophtheirus salmonis TaxID=72036 RepID=A0A0K2TDH1_LEPSM
MPFSLKDLCRSGNKLRQSIFTGLYCGQKIVSPSALTIDRNKG